MSVSVKAGLGGTGWKHEYPSLVPERKKGRKFNETERQEMLRGGKKNKIVFYAVYTDPVEPPSDAAKARISINKCVLCWVIKTARVLIIKG